MGDFELWEVLIGIWMKVQELVGFEQFVFQIEEVQDFICGWINLFLDFDWDIMGSCLEVRSDMGF